MHEDGGPVAVSWSIVSSIMEDAHTGECLQVEGLQAHFKTVEAERDALHAQLLQAFNARNALAEKEAELASAASEREQLRTHLDIATEMIGEQNARVRLLMSHFCVFGSCSSVCTYQRCGGLAPKSMCSSSTHHACEILHACR
jgi:hypothetical protein